MVAESIGTARAQRTAVKSCSAGSLSIKWKPVLFAIKAVMGTWGGMNMMVMLMTFLRF